MIGSGREENGLYFLTPHKVESNEMPRSAHHSLRETLSREAWLWHQRLGHPSFSLLSHLFPSLIRNKHIPDALCEACELSKHHRATFNLSMNKSTIPFQLVHIDVWGPSHISSLHGYKWFVTFIDDFSRTTWVYLMKEKSDVFSIFKNFHKMICTQFSTVVKIVRSDRGGE